jgi:hypothetical protein
MYKLLYQDKDLEVRKYPPSRRTICMGWEDHTYFLHFPYMIFAVRKQATRFGGYMRHRAGQFLYANFAKEDDEFAYGPPLANINNVFSVCLGSHYDEKKGVDWYGHFHQPDNTSFEDLVGMFWASSFSSMPWGNSVEALRFNYRSLHNWSELSQQEVLDRLTYLKMSVEDLIIGPWSLDYDDEEMQTNSCLISHPEPIYCESVVATYNFKKSGKYDRASSF